MKKIIFLFIFLLSLSLVAAIVEVEPINHQRPGMVTVSVDCEGLTVLQFQEPNGNLIDMQDGEGTWTYNYNTQSDLANGNYSVVASCGDSQEIIGFCVNDADCVGEVPSVQDDQPPVDQPSAPSTSTSSSGGGGGGGCIAQYHCGYWSVCDASLEHERVCVDKSRCKKKDKVEIRDCEPCPESWVCTEWSSCSKGVQQRECVDEHGCGTAANKPKERKGCQQASSGPAPVRTTPYLPPEPPQPITRKPASFFDQYGTWIIGSILILLVLLGVSGYFYFRKREKKVFNVSALRTWIRKERELGTSDADIREILEDHTGWKEEEMNQAFGNNIKPKEK